MRNRFFYSVIVSTVLLFSSLGSAEGTGGPLGLGVVLGDPTALTIKYHADERTAYDAGLAFNLSQWILLYGDYNYKFSNILRSGDPGSSLIPYLGLGAFVAISNKPEYETRNFRYFDSSSSSRTAVGIRVPLGIEWRLNRLPLGIFAEVAPGITVVPGTYVIVQGGLGIRFYF